MSMIAGLDVGTTGCKLAIYDQNARLLDVYYNEYESVHSGGQHEIDFMVVKNGVKNLLKKAVAEYKIAAVGVTSFGETFAMLDENDNILAPSMLYTDPRGKEECDALCKAIGTEKLTLLTGVKPHQMYSISKIVWNKNNNPEAFLKCKRILLGQDFIVYTLTGNAVIDYSLAARTGAFDVEKKCWIKEIFDVCGVDISLMSKAVGSGNVAGNIKTSLKEELGIDYDITIVNGCHDQVAAMIGAGVFDETTAMDGTGTVECIPVILNNKAARYGASVEAEVGSMGERADGYGDHHGESIYTDPTLAKDFVEATGVDALACAFGTVHGLSTKELKLDYERITMIGDVVEVPLVMHGASGLKEEEFREVIRRGIRKINYYTSTSKIAAETIGKKKYTQYHDAVIDATLAIKEDVKNAIKIYTNK